MSAAVTEQVRDRLPWSGSRILALLAAALAIGAPLRTMYYLSDVVGDPTLFLALVALSFVGATLLARVLRPTLAVGVGAMLFAGGLGAYILNLSTDPAVTELLADTAALLTGRSLLQIAKVRLWVLSFAPAPVFLTWYFALRRWYVTATLTAGTALAFFALTTDAGVVTTLLGVVGIAATIGFGTLDTLSTDEPADLTKRPGAVAVGEDQPSDDSEGIDTGRRAVLEQLAAIIVIPAALSQVPFTRGSWLSYDDGSDGQTVEGSLFDAGESLSVRGSISLTPEIRYTVESEEPRYWRVTSYDRYTGNGWVRTGNPIPYDDQRLDSPPGETRTLRQEFRAESTIGTVPAAWKPVRYSGEASVSVSNEGGFQPDGTLSTGDSYQVRSELLVATPDGLREAGTDYDDTTAELYTQLPDSTPARVTERTAILTANAENPYETALVVERWLQESKGYSLDVDRPDFNVADAFLFEMDEGYCVYFATTMATMLRTQGIPARMTVGYTSGQRIDEDQWVVRGLNSHAWVEVYFPGQGWVQFDPTPSGPREEIRQQRIEDTSPDESSPTVGDGIPVEQYTPADTSTPAPLTETESTESEPTETPTATETDTETSPTERADTGDETRLSLPDLPSREEMTLGVVALLGIAAGARRTGLSERAYRTMWLRYQRRVDPETDIEQAFQRAMYVLAKEHRHRENGETVRSYLDAIEADSRVRRLATLREQLRYGGEVDEAMADEAVEIANGIVSDR
ncbi:transglutaminase [Haloarcula sp. CBA1130]|uniref:transglutaminase family protein n=1 Tax=unclassified Haloarcula TaxID=2624677 RepID=UPI001246AC09|nr:MULTISPECIES: transglutaminase domain-containing protein [unclassified Haloarcula]KAA9399629.1 transglutaminase [Haloarcula sp. CBA1129]KAA9401353.1 transglutaminase [Haloarcula sp. CBA1130]